MERINRILNNPEYNGYLKAITNHEEHRIFCGHDLQHFMDVARIAYILNLENQLGIDKDVIYAAALLHDIGRFLQYENGTPHDQASLTLAPKLLEDAGYSDSEMTAILEAIGNHRNKNFKDIRSFSGIFYRADKLSRGCFMCSAQYECDWDDNKKNLNIDY